MGKEYNIYSGNKKIGTIEEDTSKAEYWQRVGDASMANVRRMLEATAEANAKYTAEYNAKRRMAWKNEADKKKYDELQELACQCQRNSYELFKKQYGIIYQFYRVFRYAWLPFVIALLFSNPIAQYTGFDLTALRILLCSLLVAFLVLKIALSICNKKTIEKYQPQCEELEIKERQYRMEANQILSKYL